MMKREEHVSTHLSGKAARDLCESLLWAESEDEIIAILQKHAYWNAEKAWRKFGDKENNFSIIGNQQSDPAAAMIEKFVNAVDAVLMLNCYQEGVHPEAPEAPGSISEALERYFNIRDGNLANVGARKRTRLAENVGFVATGRKRTPNYTVFDKGEGQTPDAMPGTLLSLSESNKLRIPFVQGKFNMGGTGALQFCGGHNLQLVISRRNPHIADSSDPSSVYWGFTIVRRESPGEGRRSSMFTYLAPDGVVPRFAAEEIRLPGMHDGTQPLPLLEWGTVIKMFEYEMSGMKTNILFDFYNQASLLLPRVGLPIRFYERRDYSGHSLESTMAGLHVRLEEDKRENLEDGFPTHHEFKVAGEELHASVYAFQKGSADKYRRSEGIIFTINGQTHGVLSQSFFTRDAVRMSYLADSLLVIVECDGISGRTREDLFMNSRDRLRSGGLRSLIERRLEEILREHPGLRELRERRRREVVEDRLADARPLKDMLGDILKKSPALSALFVTGTDLGNPFKSRLVGEKPKFEGEPHPTYFRLQRGEEHKNCHINLRFRVQFETDVTNDYFGRDSYPGRFRLHVNGQPSDDYVLNLWNGVATLTISLPPDTEVGADLHCECWVEDDVLIDPFHNTFTRHVTGPIKIRKGQPGKRQPPAGNGTGERQTPEGLSMPEVFEVREERWADHGFDKYSALKVVGTGEGSYDFFVNIDNVYLRSEIKSARSSDPRVLEAQFKFSLVLIGLALLKEKQKNEEELANGRHGKQDSENVEARLFEITRAIAPVLLPLIDTLGALDIEEVMEGEILSAS
jgi:hypothetical protein